MIELVNVYRCKCEKCQNEWTAKDAVIPATCAKCRSVKWNTQNAPKDDITAKVKALGISQRLALFEHFELCCGMNRGACICEAETAQPSQPITDEPKDALAAFIAKAQAKKGIVAPIIATDPEPMDEWIGWGKEEQTYDDQTGEMRTFRRHIKTGRVKWLDSETAMVSV